VADKPNEQVQINHLKDNDMHIKLVGWLTCCYICKWSGRI
jgi:hypothetical protein